MLFYCAEKGKRTVKLKRLYLHVGTRKTGTTSLQHFLYNNRELLEAQGYLYPVIGCFFHQLSKSQSRLAFACKKKRSKLLPSTLKLSLPDCIQDLHGCLRRSTAENVIISSEIFWGELNTEDIHRIRVALNPLFQSIQIIIYLRPQDEYLEASYNQFVKMGLTRAPFDQFVNQRLQSTDLSLRYYHAVQAFWQIFGRENVLVRRYSPNHLVAMNVIEDLTTIIGCGSAKPFKTHGRLNESLPIELLTILRELNIRYCRSHQDFLATR